MAAAVAEGKVSFHTMNEEELRQWVEANPGRVNDRDNDGYTPLYVAACEFESLALVVWLVDEKGADVNATTLRGHTPLDEAVSLDLLTALSTRGADPTLQDKDGYTPLMHQAFLGCVINMTRLLQDPRVRTSIDLQARGGRTALHCMCYNEDETVAATMAHLLLQAGANPALVDKDELTPVDFLRQEFESSHPALVLLEKVPDAEKASLLVKARRLAVAANSHTVAPSCLQTRVVQGQTLPRVELTPVPDDHNEDRDEEEDGKLHTLVAFILGMEGGPKGDGMPRDVFRVAMDLLMPTWDPLRRKGADSGPPAVQG